METTTTSVPIGTQLSNVVTDVVATAKANPVGALIIGFGLLIMLTRD